MNGLMTSSSSIWREYSWSGGVKLISIGGMAPTQRCADGCGNGRCDCAGTGPPRSYRWIRNKPLIPGSAWASPSTCSPPRTASRADHVVDWSPGRWPARARCSSVYIKLTQVMPCLKPYITVYIRTYAHTHARTFTRSIANSTRKGTQTQTHENANKRTKTHRCDGRVGDFCVETRLRFAH